MSLRPFALTYPQLMSQALAQGRPASELALLRRAYDFAERMADGLYRAQGMPFICHLVRTASIALAERQPAEVVAACLVHSAYRLHCFDDSRRSPRASHLRRQLAGEVPEAVEALMAGYEALAWYSRGAIERYAAEAATCASFRRHLLVMRLANELEDYLDLGMAYRGRHPFQRQIEAYGDAVVELARRLGMPTLAAELQEGYRQCMASALPDAVLRGRRDAYELPTKRWGQMGRVEQWYQGGRRRIQRYLRRTIAAGRV